MYSNIYVWKYAFISFLLILYIVFYINRMLVCKLLIYLDILIIFRTLKI